MSTKTRKFNPGDCVRLKSGGPVMVVNNITSTGLCKCVWFNSDGRAMSLSSEAAKSGSLPCCYTCEHDFHENALEEVKS